MTPIERRLVALEDQAAKATPVICMPVTKDQAEAAYRRMLGEGWPQPLPTNPNDTRSSAEKYLSMLDGPARKPVHTR